MDISIFDVAGPIMIGPSSSHTAGPARLARLARAVAGGDFARVSFGLHGSFAKTGLGHGTRQALVAGALGMREDDERLAASFELAAERGVAFDFYDTELDGFHENSAVITFYKQGGEKTSVAGSSVGGGQVLVRRIDGFEVELDARRPSLVAFWQDRKGMVSAFAHELAERDVNIGAMRLSRAAKGGEACCVMEADAPIPPNALAAIRLLPSIISAITIEVL